MPVFRQLDEIRSHGIPFEVSHRRQQMSVGLHRKRLESPLIQMRGPAVFERGIVVWRFKRRQTSHRSI